MRKKNLMENIGYVFNIVPVNGKGTTTKMLFVH